MGQDDVVNVGMAVDRGAPVWFVAMKRVFPPVGVFVDLDVDSWSREAINLCVDAPWFRWNKNVAGDVFDCYIDTEGWLPCGVSLVALETFYGSSTYAS